MRLRVVILPTAADEIDVADRWWQLHRLEAPNAVREDVAEALNRVAEQPTLGLAVPGARWPGNRRLLLRRTRYHLYYRLRADRIEVLRLWHSSRGQRPRL